MDERREAETSGSLLRRVPCDEVISAIDRDPERERGHATDVSALAEHLRTSIAWVERCMEVYGRHVKRPDVESGETREQRLENLEEDEPEEIGADELEEPGAHGVHQRQHEHREKERVPRPLARPTPSGEEAEW